MWTWPHRPMGKEVVRADNSAPLGLIPPEVHTHMYPTILIIIFLLFFAVLAFGWFYWQRAKTRTAVETTDVASETVDAAPAPVETDAPAASDMATASNDQQ